MTKASIIGVVSAVTVIVSAFLPWLTVESKQLVFTGVNTVGSSFGEPGKLNIGVAVVSGILFLLQNKWAMRINLFATAFLSAWTFRNLLLFSRCEMGECPHREIALYLSLIAALATFVCVLLDKGKK